MPQPDSPTPYAAPQRAVRARKSIEESGGEEILYPRSIVKTRPAHDSRARVSDASGQTLRPIGSHSRDGTSDSAPSVPPTVFNHTPKAKKRTSDEFGFDQGGAPISKTSGSSTSPAVRRDERRRSTGFGSLSSKDRERIRERRQKDNVAISMGGLPKTGTTPLKDREPRERHARRSSASASLASSSSKEGDSSHSRRTHDFSHLPASPSTIAIQPHARGNPGPSAAESSPNPSHHSTASVAHSLLRGTQEGWSGMDDSATAEALRKLDGISGRSLRARSSLISVNSKSSSRPGTPGSRGGQWEGMEGSASLKRRSSLKDRDHASVDSTHHVPLPIGLPEGADNEWPASPGHRKGIPSTASTRSSYGVSPAKRSSGGSTTGTPATSVSRDSTSISTSTSLTSASNASNRHSINNGKLRRSNSTGSDISSIHSSEKDRVAALAAGEHPDLASVAIPPVPPLPKVFKTSQTPMQQTFPSISAHEDLDRTIVVPVIETSSPHRQSVATSAKQVAPIIPPAPTATVAPAPHTPSKKWSFNLRLPSSSKEHSSGPLSPRSPRTSSNNAQNRASIAISATSKTSAGQKDASRFSSSVERLSSSPSMSSLLQMHSPQGSPAFSTQRLASGSQQSFEKLSRPGTASSSGHQAPGSVATLAAPLPGSGSPQKRNSTHKRLTPTSIPFFKRASTHGTPPTTTLSPSSPTMPVNMPTTPLQSLTRLTPPDLTLSPGSSTAKKTSVFGQLLKASTSRSRSHGDKSDKEGKEKSGDERKEKKKEDKERSESRISVLMGRRRGKVC